MRSGKDSPTTALRGAWRRAVAAGLLVAAVSSASCGGRSREVVGQDAGEGAGGSTPSGGFSFGGTSGTAARGGGSGSGTGGASGASGSSATGGEPPFVDPGCPDASAPPGRMDCDVFGTPTGCGPGEGCYPTLDHPFGMGCEQQTHGSRCVRAGTAVQGEPCPGGTFDCASGFICIVGAQAGSRCMRICSLDGSLSCPDGLVCAETDARGVGVCA